MDNLQASFSTLVLSLSTSALSHMGTPVVEGEQPEKNLDLAQFNIDLLMMLKNKTENNLSTEESQLLNSAVNDLQMKFLAAKK